MDKKTILIILGVIVALAVIIFIGLIALGSSEFTMEGDAAQVTVPGNYTYDDKAFVASSQDGVNITITPIQGTTNDMLLKFYGAVRDNGKDSGYENVSNKTINGYNVYEYAGHPDQLKNVSTNREVSGNYESWTEYPPEAAAVFTTPVDHFRAVIFEKDGKINQMNIYTDNSSTNLYTPEIDAIINSIAPITK